jgi:hypothetical protein
VRVVPAVGQAERRAGHGGANIRVLVKNVGGHDRKVGIVRPRIAWVSMIPGNSVVIREL